MTSPTTPSPAETIADQLHSAAIHLLRGLRERDDLLGISAPRLSALSVVVFAGPLPIGELAAAEGVRPPTMTRLVDGLERDGLVAREPNPDDHRTVHVRATSEGARILKRSRAARVALLMERIARLPRSDREALARAAEIMERAFEGQ